MKLNYFLRIFEQKRKFRHLTFERKEGKKTDRRCSSCLFEKFNGFQVVYLENENTIRILFRPINIIYEPVPKQTEIVNCFFSDCIHLSLIGFQLEKNRKHWTTAWECYFCLNYFRRKQKFDAHVKHCAGQRTIVYNLNTNNLVTSKDYLKYKDDIPLSVYIDFETNSPAEKGVFFSYFI